MHCALVFILKLSKGDTIKVLKLVRVSSKYRPPFPYLTMEIPNVNDGICVNSLCCKKLWIFLGPVNHNFSKSDMLLMHHDFRN